MTQHMKPDYRPYYEAGFRIMGLHPIANGQCGCGDAECPMAGKHPIASAWQHTPEWSEEQLECMELSGQLSTGYGLLCTGWLVVDVDARNGGVESYARLVEDHPGIVSAGLIVETGSGGGSKHLYFRLTESQPLLTHLHQYPGIDFKSSGYVVGPGSLHKSGNRYRVLYGAPSEIDEPPPSIIDALRKPDRYRAEDRNGAPLDVSQEDLRAMLACVSPDVYHDVWVRIGMALHHATGGAAFDLWDTWSAPGKTYPGTDTLSKRWHSFGKSSSVVTIGTLIHYAEEGGYQQAVTFCSDDDFTTTTDDVKPELDDAGIDLLRPPGFVGALTAWINSQCRYPRERLAVAAALVATGNIIGLRNIDQRDQVTGNLFAFCVAGSGSGKEAIQQAIADTHRVAGLHRATYGSIKSEQEIVRNLIRNQSSYYVIDEFGIFLAKIENARKRGGAAYLDGVVGILMSAYSKASGYMLLNGDTKDEVRKILLSDMASCRRQIENNEDPQGRLARRVTEIQTALEQIDNGLERPFVSLVGFTTPVTFDSMVTAEQATNGFIARALLVNESETNPRAKAGFGRKPKMPEPLQAQIRALATGGYSDAMEGRIEHYGPMAQVPTAPDASELLEQALRSFEDYAEDQKEHTGFEAIPRRAYELASKVSFILAAPSGLRTAEHVRWAVAYAMADCEAKLRLAYSNDRAKDQPAKALAMRIKTVLGDSGGTVRVLANRIRGTRVSDIEAALAALERAGEVKPFTITRGRAAGSVKWVVMG